MNFNNNEFKNQNNEAVIKTVNPETQKVLKSGAFLLKTFLFLALGLFISAAVSVLGAYLLSNYIYNTDFGKENSVFIFIGIIVVCFVGCFICSYYIGKLGLKKGNKAIIPYVIYSLLMGVLLSGLVYAVNNPYVLGFAFGITAILFIGLGIIGYFAKGKAWPIVLGAAGFIVLASVCVYLFTFLLLPIISKSQSLTNSYLWIMFGVQVGLIIVVCIYIAFDFFRIKKAIETEELSTNISVYFASQLYSDFMLLFIYILRIIAASKK